MLTRLALLSLALAPTTQDRDVVVAGPVGKRLDAYLERCTLFGFSGCVLVEKRGRLLLRKGYGLAQPREGIPNTPETLYDIASASKQVTAAAILLLEAERRLDTDDSIAKYLADVPEQHHEVRLHHLLTHTSGFGRYGGGGHGNDREAALAEYFSAKRTSGAGTRFEYFNGGYAMLAAVVERVTGEAFEDWVRDNLFLPAGLMRTDFIETAHFDTALLAGSHDTGRLTTDYIKGWGYKGMGGVLTSVSDLALWCHALFGGELLPPDSLKEMLEPERESYACGWYVFDTEKKRRVVQHGGSTPGFETYIRNFIDDDVLLLVMTNREGWNWQVTWGLSAQVLDEDPKAPNPPELAPWRAAKLDEVCGTWGADGGERLVVRRSGAGLLIGGLGTEVLAALTAAPARGDAGASRAAPPASPTARELAAAEERALAMVAGLREGSSERLAADMLPHIPKSWPDDVVNRYWPAQVERWGEVCGQRSLGAFFDPRSGRIRVWIRLDHERGERSLEVAFVGTSLNIFDLNARDFPVEVGVAPVDAERLVGFDFNEQPPCEFVLRGNGKTAQLELESRNGSTLVFRRERQR